MQHLTMHLPSQLQSFSASDPATNRPVNTFTLELPLTVEAMSKLAPQQAAAVGQYIVGHSLADATISTEYQHQRGLFFAQLRDQLFGVFALSLACGDPDPEVKLRLWDELRQGLHERRDEVLRAVTAAIRPALTQQEADHATAHPLRS